MKQFHHPFKILLFVVIYCFGIFASVKTLPTAIAQTTVQNKKQKEYTTTVSNVLYTHVQESENLLSDFTAYETSDFKTFSNNFEPFVCSNEFIFRTKFKQYQNYFKNLLIRNRKTDLIFPFHNFW
ncbi:hypothetical protein [Polaribacter sp. IC073]|uniref:hypothetical protein n=1 Tax=Polaribacter sp. IC073 TaxID=2508540 RepID=UPI001CB8A42A|nr:hypothetical protein [Polaribacter sp. IC073]